MELAAKDTAEFMGKTPSLMRAINRVATPDREGDVATNKSQTGSSGKHCYRCGDKHDAQSCWHKKTKCHGCLKVHETPQTHVQEQTGPGDQACNIRGYSEGGESSDELDMYYIEKSKHKREHPAAETGRED